MELSIVIPVWNEEKKIARDIEMAAQFISDAGYLGEIIIADDASNDETISAASSAREKVLATTSHIDIRIVRGDCHRGKGAAVKRGITASKADYVLFADSGVCVPYENALMGLDMLRNDKCDIAHGSRRLPGSYLKRPWSRPRRIMSNLFRWFTRHFVELPPHLTDTQCGFKLYKGDIARKLYAECQTEDFMFDIEIILRAKAADYVIREFPVTWSWDTDSRLHPLKKSFHWLTELIRIQQMKL